MVLINPPLMAMLCTAFAIPSTLFPSIIEPLSGHIITAESTTPVLPDFSDGFTPALILQIFTFLVTIASIVFGLTANLRGQRKEGTEVKKNLRELIEGENRDLLKRISKFREMELRYWLLYETLIKTEGGRDILTRLGIIEENSAAEDNPEEEA